MYKVLVVDDEELLCQGVKLMLERLDYPRIQEIHLAYNGDEAEKKAKELQPDIIFTDIRMPDISGIQLIKKVREFDHHARFVVISGYDEFQYAKEAFKLGAVDYLVKPVKLSELGDVLQKVISSLEEERENRKLEENATSKYRQAVLENGLNRLLISGRVDSHTLSQVLQESGIHFAFHWFSIGIVALNGSAKPDLIPGVVQENVHQILEYVCTPLLEKKSICAYPFDSYNDRWVILFNYERQNQYRETIEYISLLADRLNERIPVQTVSASSDPGKDFQSLSTLYGQATEALSYKIVYENTLIEYANIRDRSDQLLLVEGKLMELEDALQYSRVEKISEFIDSVFSPEVIGKASVNSLKRAYNGIQLAAERICSQAPFSPVSHRPFESFISAGELRIHLKDTLIAMVKSLQAEGTEKTVVDIAKKYIRENYSKDIDMAMVANMVSMSYTYFSKIFKEQTGASFTDYLMSVRMEMARKMLGDPLNKISEISIKVGYDNPKHFTRAFRNYFGVSPKDYRERS